LGGNHKLLYKFIFLIEKKRVMIRDYTLLKREIVEKTNALKNKVYECEL
jgi:hypothetical protein